MSELRYDTISFLSDYGLDDEFVGVVKSVVRSIAPRVAVVDITHAVAPHDVRGGGLALARASSYLVPGVVLAIVDPGVGTARRAIAVEVGDGASVLFGPDNGVLAPTVALCGGATAAYELTNVEYHLDAPGATFAGRDVFAPAAAHLCNGVPLHDLGTPIDVHSLTPGLMAVSRVEGDAIIAEVLWVDRFGNAQLNVDADDVAALGPRLRIRHDDQVRSVRRARTYGDLGPGEVGAVVDSYGLVSLCLDRRSASVELGIAVGDQVRLERSEDDVSVPVRLTRRGGTSEGSIT
jgi:S-adenosylmethionine hydrolase